MISHKKGFASDNYAGAVPEVLQAIAEANNGHAPSYGADALTEKARQDIRHFLGAPEAEVFFVFNGTGANVLCLSAAAASHQSVLVADVSHYYNDEGSAPETFSGCRLFPIPADEYGKLTPENVLPRLKRKGDVHYAQPAMVSITQGTEYGTLYNPKEIGNLSALCKEHELFLHVDGSRFFNAVAGLCCAPSELVNGVDMLCLGGTKAGMLFGEAVVVFNPKLAEVIRYKQKQVMQLASKTRFIAAQFSAMLHDGCWKKYATHANDMAQKLSTGLGTISGIKITKPTQANGVFATMPRDWIAPLQAEYPFYTWDEATDEVRLMCAWDTTKEEVEEFLMFIRKAF